jgi:hypothetical protein
VRDEKLENLRGRQHLRELVDDRIILIRISKTVPWLRSLVAGL